MIGHISALKAGTQIERPTEEIERERERLATGYRELLDDDTRPAFDDLLALSRTVFPYVEEHKFFCDYWFLTRWWNKLREFGPRLAERGFLEDPEDVFQLSRYEVASALDELVLTWATGGEPLGPKHWPPIAARRKQLLARLVGVDAAAGARRRARGDHRPDDDHAVGRDHRPRPRVGAPAVEGGSELNGAPGLAGQGRGRRARRPLDRRAR